MNLSRRQFAAVAALSPLVGLAACKDPGVTFQMVQGYVKTMQGFVDKVAPLLEQIDAADAARIKTIVSNVDTAAQALEALPSPTGVGGGSLAATVLQSTLAAIQIAEMFPLPGMSKNVLEAVSLLIVVVGTFFDVHPAAAAGPPPRALVAAGSAYKSTADRPSAREAAQRAVDSWVAQ